MNILSWWNRLVGSYGEFTFEQRAFNAVSIITLAILIVILPINYALGLMPVVTLVSILIIAQAAFYYVARIKRKYGISIAAYAIGSYITLITTYYYNSGINGPAIFLFFLSFMLLVALTEKKWHLLWAALHIISATGLMAVEEFYPSWIKNTYHTGSDRFTDIATSYALTLFFVYAITIYLRNNYNREHTLAEERARAIKKQNIELAKLNEEKTKLFSIISHDLRSPLDSIKSYFQLSTQNILTYEEKALMENELLQLTQNTSDLLANLLTWSKSQMNGGETTLTSLNLYDSISDTVELQRMIAQNKNIHIHCDVDPYTTVAADANMLQLIIRNLINNAIKFSTVGSDIYITGKKVNDLCRLIIADRGIGISKEKLAKLFTLQTGTSYGTQNEKGAGLGLVLVKEFVEKMGGTVRVESQVAQGTTFYITLKPGDISTVPAKSIPTPILASNNN